MRKYIQDLKGIKNKDGKKIKANLLFRSTELSQMKPKEIEHFNNIGIKKIIDLRHPEEVKNAPDYKFDNCLYHYYPILDNNITAATHLDNKGKLQVLIDMEDLETTYERFFTSEYCLKQIKECVRDIVLNDELPVCWHCVTGKDRTGIIMMVLLGILDFDKQTIIDTYLYPKKYFVGKAYFLAGLTYLASKDKALTAKAKQMFYVSPNLIIRSMNTIDKNFGSFDLFVKNFLQISDEQKEVFKQRILIA